MDRSHGPHRPELPQALVLTEMGATSLVGSFQQPRVWDNSQPIDQSAQQRYYQAACQSVVPKFDGVYWWMYALDPPAKPELDRSYAVAGKPAEADLAACLKQLP
jgi:glycosyl hydrolase family 113